MALERIILNIIPAGDMPVFHCSQYENGRPVIIDLISSDDDAFMITEGVTVELHCRKCDDTIVTMEPDEVINNTVTFVTSEQLTACPGDNLCELFLYSDTEPVQTLGSLNFILHVEPDPIAGGLTSESEIHNLTQQIQDITQEVIGNDYYNKTEVDGLISGVEAQIPTSTSDLTNDSGFITSAALAPYAKTADLATVATTGDYDDLLNKPVIPDAQIQSDWEQADNTKVDYIKNKPDIAAMIANALFEVMPVGTATGTPATFDTEIAAPLVNVSCDIVATGGGGTPGSPVPIVGYTEANITANGDTFTIAFGQTVYFGQLIILPDRTYIHVTGRIDDLGNLNWINESDTQTGLCRSNAQFSDCVWQSVMLCTAYNYNSTTSYNGLSNEDIALTNSESIPLLRIRNTDYSTYTNAQIKEALTGVKLVYQTKTPFDIDLTPEVISAIVGTNNVSSDTNGDTTVQFKDSIQHYIDTRV